MLFWRGVCHAVRMGRAGYGKGLAEEGLREGKETGLNGEGQPQRE